MFVHAFGIDPRDYRSVENFLRVFDVGKEQSVPNWFSTINLLLSSLLLCGVYAQYRALQRPGNLYWLCLSILFFVLSVDEAVGLHNLPGHLSWYIENRPDLFPNFVPVLFDFLGFDHELFKVFTWIPFGILIVVVVGVMFIPFLWTIGLRLAFFMVLSGILFVSGAIGGETITAWMELTEYAAKGTLLRSFAILSEEALEMYGIALFNSVLFSELAKGEFRFHVLLRRD